MTPGWPTSWPMAEMSRVRASEGEIRDARGDVDRPDVDFVAEVVVSAGEPFGLDVTGIAAGVEEAVAFENVVVEYDGSAPIWSKR